MTDQSIIKEIIDSLELNITEKISLKELKDKLANLINNLIQTDFQKLISILYRIDVSETKLKNLLKENPGEDAGLIIADLIIERQLQKIKSRQEFRRDDNNISDEEKW